MPTFKSLVILDLESSGLPASGSKTRITELSMVGVLIEHVIDSNKRGETTPRVLQKLSLCFYPQKMIEFEATEMTGLDNFLLEEIPAFNRDAILMVSSFLQRMPAPVCLVAHNGMKFDFQLLKSELAAKNEVLAEEISCADSLLAFRSIFPMCSSSPARQTVCSTPPPSPIKILTDGLLNSKAETTCLTSVSDVPSITDFQKANETTPKHSIRADAPPALKRKYGQTGNEENGEKANGLARKRLFKSNEKPASHKLVDLYRHICGREQDGGHRAENDTISLLECIVLTAPNFLRFVENNNLAFSKIPCMW